MVQTSEFVRQQIEAMKAEIFELGLFRLASAAGGLDSGMLPRAWDSETLLRSIAWLRLENMRGRSVYIRPQGEHHLSLVDDSLVDDLSKSAIERMKAEGFVRLRVLKLRPSNSGVLPGSWFFVASSGCDGRDNRWRAQKERAVSRAEDQPG
jgi:hypothetical protein